MKPLFDTASVCGPRACRRVRKVGVAIIWLLALCNVQGCSNSVPEGFVNVRRVIDGDTFVLDDSKKGTHIRIIGLDAPESRKTRYEDVQPYGAEAKDYLIDLIEGKNVRLEYDVDRLDKYGRTLAYVYLEDGTFLNEKILLEGYARLSTYPPNVKHVDEFKAAQKTARDAGRGMWKDL